ncbi:MAG: hypothetical protein H5U13_06945 [Parvibaculum sp.]|nr:hypothetical protein [Parvibaculum sp.]
MPSSQEKVQLAQTDNEIFLALKGEEIPDDPNPPMRPSGLRLGTPAPTARGMSEKEMTEIGDIIADALAAKGDRAVEERLARQTRALTLRFPVPGL